MAVSDNNKWGYDLSKLLKVLGSNENGLTNKSAKNFLAKYGKNQTPYLNPPSIFSLFISQYKNALIILLILVSIFSMLIGEYVESLIIIIMLNVNASISFLQEYKAEKSLEKLKKFVIFKTRVLRDNQVTTINSAELVPGDIVYLNIGDIVPADIRLIEMHNLLLNESILTGESIPVEKSLNITQTNFRIPQEIKHGLFMGTSVTSGSAKGVVVNTGKNTFLGETVYVTHDTIVETNFQKSLKIFSGTLLKVVVLITSILFVVNSLLGHGIITSLLFGITLAIGITPEALPIIVTIAVSNAAFKLSRKYVIVRRLTALEDLGNINVLCCDKTGTLTEGKLSLTKYIDLENGLNKKILEYALICNANNPRTSFKILRNPLDDSLWEHPDSESLKGIIKNFDVLDLHDFDFNQKRMTILVNLSKKKNLIISKGAVESILDVSSYVFKGSKKIPLTNEYKNLIQNKIFDFENQGYRAITIAYKDTSENKLPHNNHEKLIFLGFMLFFDPPKKSLANSFTKLKDLDINLKIITGDSPVITQLICKKAGVEIKYNKVIIGDEIDKLSDKELKKAVERYNVFARISPEQKYKIIRSLKSNDNIVGYIGDGINDVGALNIADVGISVDTGTDVAKDSSDIILLKKDLSVLGYGIEEGRRTFSNTLKFISNTMSSSYGNVFTMGFSSLILKFLPMLPVQMLLIDSVSDLQHLTVSTDNVDKEHLAKPQQWDMKFFIRFMLFFGTISTVFDLIFLTILLVRNVSPDVFRTAWFFESVIQEVIATFSVRTKRVFFKSIPSLPVIITSIIVIIVTIIIPYSKIGQKLFNFADISLGLFLTIILILSLFFVTIEIGKQLFYKSIYK